MRKSDRSFGQGAAWLAASCTFAALEDLAAKVRPSGRRPGRIALEEEAEAEEMAPHEAPAEPSASAEL